MGKLNYKSQKKDKGPVASSAPAILFEKKVLTFVTGLLCFSIVLWLASVATDYWVIVVANGTDGFAVGSKLYLWSYSGLWRKCDIFVEAAQPQLHISQCGYHEDIVVAELVSVAIVLCLTSLSFGFSLYSLFHPKYVYKRVAGSLHLLTSCMIIVVIEMVKSENHVMFHHYNFDGVPMTDEMVRFYYGYSYLTAWIVFIIDVLAAMAFFTLSKKRKHLNHDLETQLR